MTEPMLLRPHRAQKPTQQRWALRHDPRCGLRYSEVGGDAEVVSGPDTVNRLVEDPRARDHVQGGPVVATPDHDVVDPPTKLLRPSPLRQQRVVGREGASRITRVGALPGIPVVAGDHNVQAPRADELLYGTSRSYRL